MRAAEGGACRRRTKPSRIEITPYNKHNLQSCNLLWGNHSVQFRTARLYGCCGDIKGPATRVSISTAIWVLTDTNHAWHQATWSGCKWPLTCTPTAINQYKLVFLFTMLLLRAEMAIVKTVVALGILGSLHGTVHLTPLEYL